MCSINNITLTPDPPTHASFRPDLSLKESNGPTLITLAQDQRLSCTAPGFSVSQVMGRHGQLSVAHPSGDLSRAFDRWCLGEKGREHKIY